MLVLVLDWFPAHLSPHMACGQLAARRMEGTQTAPSAIRGSGAFSAHAEGIVCALSWDLH